MFILHLVLSFLAGGLWVTLSTITAERFGTRIGGVLSGLPSTVLVAFFFIALSQGPEAAFKVTTTFPLTFSANSFFLLTFAVLSKKKNFLLSITSSTFVWFFLQLAVFAADFDKFYISILIWFFVFSTVYLIFHKINVGQYQGSKRIHYHFKQLACRALISGAIVAFAVFMSKVAGPVWGSIFSAFPAVFFSTLIILNSSLGRQSTTLISKPMMTSGMFNVVLFCILFRYLILELHFILAITISYLITAVIFFVIYNFTSLYGEITS